MSLTLKLTTLENDLIKLSAGLRKPLINGAE